MSVSASPVHSIHEYGHGIYKVVTFKGVRDPDNVYFRNGEDAQHLLSAWCSNTWCIVFKAQRDLSLFPESELR